MESQLARSLILAGRRWRARLDERLRSVGQTNARWETLYWVLDSPEGLNQRELAEKVGIETPTLVRLLDLLEEQGLVRRTPNPKDRRAKIITATPAATEALSEGRRIALALRGGLLATSSTEEIAVALRVLTRLNGQLERL